MTGARAGNKGQHWVECLEASTPRWPSIVPRWPWPRLRCFPAARRNGVAEGLHTWRVPDRRRLTKLRHGCGMQCELADQGEAQTEVERAVDHSHPPLRPRGLTHLRRRPFPVSTRCIPPHPRASDASDAPRRSCALQQAAQTANGKRPPACAANRLVHSRDPRNTADRSARA
jgi:hypothetical protein